MKKITLSLLSLLGAGFTMTPAFAASDLMVAATMQRCTTNEECALVTGSCQDNCGFVPVNKSNLPALEGMYQQRCGKAMSSNPTCTMNPPLAAACVNSRCTIDYPYVNNSGAGDYKAGAYAVPEAAVPSKVPAAPYEGVNDRQGFTAYNLPSDAVKQNTVGTIVTKIYVPPSAPVSGGNYVPVTPNMAITTATAPAPAPVVSPVAPAPVTVTAPAAVPAPAPAVIPAAAVPTNSSYATPPVMTPSKPNQLPPAVQPTTPAYVPPAPAEPTYVPPAAPAPMAYVPPAPAPAVAAPAVPATPSYVPAETMPAGPAIPAVGASGVPQAPPGSTPIPPSDLQPTPTFVPPTGTAIPVAPEDPGAPPPPGTTIIMKAKKGVSEDMTVVPSTNKTNFNASPKTTTSGTTNQ